MTELKNEGSLVIASTSNEGESMLTAKEQVAAALAGAKKTTGLYERLTLLLEGASSMDDVKDVFYQYKEVQEEMGEGAYVFTYTKGQKFWALYKSKKAEYEKCSVEVFDTMYAMLAACTDYLMMRDVIFKMNEYKEKNGVGEDEHLFPYKESKRFWGLWKAKKAAYHPQYLANQETAVREIEELIHSSSSVVELKVLRFKMWENPYINSKAIGGPLQDEIDNRIVANS